MINKILGSLIASSPRLRRTLWKTWYDFLAGGYKQNDWTFMNYGFAELKGAANPEEAAVVPQTLRLEPDDENNRYSIQLYQAVLGGVGVAQQTVLEVGSGRGGGSAYIARYLKPQAALGIDFSDKAVTFSNKRHAAIANLSFQQGDAEALPCQDGSFDMVINVESSHCYGSMDRFLGEVFRVLRPGGHFGWVDMSGPDEWEKTRAQFERAGFAVRQEENITPGVLLALDRVSDRKRETISRFVPRYLLPMFEDFAGVRGTRVYESLRNGAVEYRRCLLQRPV